MQTSGLGSLAAAAAEEAALAWMATGSMMQSSMMGMGMWTGRGMGWLLLRRLLQQLQLLERQQRVQRALGAAGRALLQRAAPGSRLLLKKGAEQRPAAAATRMLGAAALVALRRRGRA